MGMSERGSMDAFERRHVQLSFTRSMVLMALVLPVSGFHVSPLWLVLTYGLAFGLGLGAGERTHGVRARMFDRRVARVVAWDDIRPVAGFFAVFLLLPFALGGLEIFAHWLEEDGARELSLNEGAALLRAAFAEASQLSNPWFLACAAAGPLAGVVCGLMDGFWVGSVRSRRGVGFREVIPFGRAWSDWRSQESRCRRSYLRGAE